MPNIFSKFLSKKKLIKSRSLKNISSKQIEYESIKTRRNKKKLSLFGENINKSLEIIPIRKRIYSSKGKTKRYSSMSNLYKLHNSFKKKYYIPTSAKSAKSAKSNKPKKITTQSLNIILPSRLRSENQMLPMVEYRNKKQKQIPIPLQNKKKINRF